MREAMSARPQTAYLGADRAGMEFWLSGPHVFSTTADGARTRHVCTLARWGRHSRGRCRCTTKEASG